jgi:hypothetical protein
MAGVEGKPASFNTIEVTRGPQVEKIHVPHVLKPEGERKFACGVAELMEGLFELPVCLITFLFPGILSRVHDHSGACFCCNGKAVGHDSYGCRADGFKEGGNIHPVVGCVEHKVR